MEYVQLGRTDLHVSTICFGCWQMGGTFWGPVDEETMIAAVHRAIDLGVNFFDTAAAYGNGYAEDLLGRALKSAGRRQAVVATKVYHHWMGQDGSRRMGDLSHDYILWECEQSLRRLGVDCIDLYQAHSFDVFTPLEETVRALETLRKQGKIRYYGTSNFHVEQLRAALHFGAFDTVQPMYSLMTRQIEADLLPLCMTHNLGVLAYSPLHHGLLTGKYTGRETFEDFRAGKPAFQGEQFRQNVERVRRLKPIAEAQSGTLPQLAIRFVLEHAAVHCAIVGIKTPEQIEEAVGAADWRLSQEAYYQTRQTFDA